MQRFRYEHGSLPLPSHSIKTLTLLALFSFLKFSLVCPAAIIRVPQDYSIIWGAIDAAVHGDEIIVSPGTYYENIRFNDKNIILHSTDPTNPSVVASTIIHGDPGFAVVTFSGDEASSCVLSGFTITNGSSFYGGGINANGTEATIQYNIITGNSGNNGGGISASNGIIQNNVISNNVAAEDGGGLYACDRTIIQNNIIYGNVAEERGGGLAQCEWGKIQNNIIYGNSAPKGGGLAHCNRIYNNTIYGNSASLYGGGVYECDLMRNCIVWGNTAQLGDQGWYCDRITYCCIQDYLPSSSLSDTNISAHPHLVDPANGDFHLLPTSPCIDAGGDIADLMQDFEGDPRPYKAIEWEPRGDGSGFDIGADEYAGIIPQPTPRLITVPGDYPTIQAAIDAAMNGDEIVVSPRRYIENIFLEGKNIVLRSTGPTSPTVVATTVIDANKEGPVVTFSGTELPSCVLSGFTITHAENVSGEGIYGNQTRATIQYNFIWGNESVYTSGIGWVDGTVQNNLITGNTGREAVFVGNGIFQNNIVTGNNANALNGCNGMILNNTIYGNTGFGFDDCDGLICNCIIWGNAGGQLTNSSMPLYSCIQGWTDGRRGNISDDPRFVDPAHGNFHLLPDSPCINAGVAFYFDADYIDDIDGECRLAGSAVDIGADEYNSSPDTDGDLLADSDEIALGSDTGNTDTDGDGLIDGAEVLRGTHPAIPNAPTGISIPFHFPSIQQGIFLAFPSEVVIVSPGTYYEKLYFMGKNLILASTNPLDGDVVDNTVVDGGGIDSVILFKGTEDQRCVVRGLTIRNGYSSGSGAGIYGNRTHATIENNNIFNNRARGFGGICRCDGLIQNNDIANNEGSGIGACSGTFLNNIIAGNSSYSGGGFGTCDGIFEYNIIFNNTAVSQGGGFYDCEGIIRDNIIAFNSASDSGGGIIKCDDSTIENNIIACNTAGYNAGGIASASGTLKDNIIICNSASNDGGGLSSFQGTIRGNTISDNSAHGDGGGLYSCQGTIERNTISDNVADGYGGGLAECGNIIKNNAITNNSAGEHGGGLSECGYNIQNNTIVNNSAYRNGGGIFGCYGTMLNNIVAGNSARYRGGGGYGSGTIQNTIITGNTSGNLGGGLYIYLPKTSLSNCTISDNSAASGGGGVYAYNPTPTPTLTPRCPPPPNFLPESDNNDPSAAPEDTSHSFTTAKKQNLNSGHEPAVQESTFKNCIFWDNLNTEISCNYLSPSVSYSCIKGGWAGTGNIDAPPLFVNPGHWTGAPGTSTWVQGNYHLTADSPCIDAGGLISGLTVDFEGDPRGFDGSPELRGDGSDYDIGADEFFTYAIICDFTASEEGWTSGSAGIFRSPEFVFTPGSVSLVSQTNTNTFGFWNSPSDALRITKDYLYRARYIISTNITSQSEVPGIRLRVNSSSFQQSDCLTIESNGDGGASPTPAGTAYDLYFTPLSNDMHGTLAFDMLNFNPLDAAHAELALDSVVVERFLLDTLSSPTVVRSYDFAMTDEGWTAGGAPIVFTNPEFLYEAGALTLRSTTNQNTFGFWNSNPADITIAANLLYKGTFEVRTDVYNRSQVPQLRLRLNTANSQASRIMGIESCGNGACSPEGTNTTYDNLYFLPPANCVGEGLIVSFDLLNFLPDDATTGSVTLDRATIETLPIPSSP